MEKWQALLTVGAAFALALFVAYWPPAPRRRKWRINRREEDDRLDADDRRYLRWWTRN